MSFTSSSIEQHRSQYRDWHLSWRSLQVTSLFCRKLTFICSLILFPCSKEFYTHFRAFLLFHGYFIFMRAFDERNCWVLFGDPAGCASFCSHACWILQRTSLSFWIICSLQVPCQLFLNVAYLFLIIFLIIIFYKLACYRY